MRVAEVQVETRRASAVQVASAGAEPEARVALALQPQRRRPERFVASSHRTNMRPGYLRRNGVPYSGNTVLTEFFDRTDETNGDVWLVVTSIITDPQYLTEPFILTTHFKRESDGSKFSPRPCDVTPPVVGKVAPR